MSAPNTRDVDLERIIIAAHALTRIAALETKNDTPAAQWRTLSLLSNQGPIRLGELAVLSRVTQPGMTRLVGQLADSGLVIRASDPADSRATVITVTDAGEQALASWRRQLRETLAPHFADLDDDDWAAIARTADLLNSRTLAPATSASTLLSGAAR